MFDRRSIINDKKIEDALSAVHRSISAAQFYPPKHPRLEESLKDGYKAWKKIKDDYRWEEQGLRLQSGSLWFGDSKLGATSPSISSLAKSFSQHGLLLLKKSDTFSLSLEGFSKFVRLLASAPDASKFNGGIVEDWNSSQFAAELHLRGAAATRISDFLPEAKTKRQITEDSWGTALSETGEVAALSDPLLLKRLQSFKQRGAKERRALDLLLQLGRAENITTFLDLLREITQIVHDYAEVERFKEAFHIVLYLYREAQNMDALGKTGKKDYLMDTVKLLVKRGFLQWLIDFISSAQGEEEAEVGEYILRALGKDAVVPMINALVAENSRFGRRRLVDILVSIGDPVVPWAIKMLDDQRWYVVRNMVTILGGIGSREATKGLSRLIADQDGRVRREVARALGRSHSCPAEDLLLQMLNDPDPAVRLMAISASAGHKTERMLNALWRLYRGINIRSYDWTLKPAIIQSIGLMGLEGGTNYLESIVSKKRFFKKARWKTVQQAAIQALGDLGGNKAESLLSEFREDKDMQIRTAAIRALASASAAVPAARD